MGIGATFAWNILPRWATVIAMAYVPAASAEPGSAITVAQRGKIFQAKVAPMPFGAHRYHRKGAGQ